MPKDSENELPTYFAIEHFLVFIVIILRVVFNCDPTWLTTFRKRSKNKSEVKMLTESKMKRYQLVMQFVKKQIAARFSKNKTKKEEYAKNLKAFK